MKKFAIGYLPLVLLGYLLPYTLFQNVYKIYGSFMFWIGYALIAIFLMSRMMDSWKNGN